LRNLTESQSLLTIFANFAEKNFQGSLQEMKLGSPASPNPAEMFAFSPVEVTPKVRPSISCKQIMIALLFAANGRLILNPLPKGSKCHQDNFIANLLPALNRVRTGNARFKVAMTLIVHMDLSMCHNGAKMTEKMSFNRLRRATHPADSPDISPCDFWPFGTKQGMI
jgi:hypothetical protein